LGHWGKKLLKRPSKLDFMVIHGDLTNKNVDIEKRTLNYPLAIDNVAMENHHV
jgi:hypothetical protein